MRCILIALLPLLGLGCATTALINASSEPMAVADHLGPVERAYRTASNELVVCLSENFSEAQFNRPCRLVFPLGKCESATNTVIIPRRYFRKKPYAPPPDAIAVPVATAAIDYPSLLLTGLEFSPPKSIPIQPGTIYNIRDPDSGIYSFGYGSTTTPNLVVFQLAVRSRNMRPLLWLIPVTAAVDIATAPVWLWLLAKTEEVEDDLFHHHHHRCKPPRGHQYFD